jgi:hypothetical protein
MQSKISCPQDKRGNLLMDSLPNTLIEKSSLAIWTLRTNWSPVNCPETAPLSRDFEGPRGERWY